MTPHDFDPTPRQYPRPTIHPGPRGMILYAVPSSPLPENQRLVFAAAREEDHGHIENVTLSIPRDRVEAFLEFMARTGAIDREPTAQECSAFMMHLGNVLVSAQIDALASVSEVAINTLGDGDQDAARERCLGNLAEGMARSRAKAEGLTQDEAAQEAERMADAMRAWIEGMERRHQDGNQEGGAA